jgi:hypothetical protein
MVGGTDVPRAELKVAMLESRTAALSVDGTALKWAALRVAPEVAQTDASTGHC